MCLVEQRLILDFMSDQLSTPRHLLLHSVPRYLKGEKIIAIFVRCIYIPITCFSNAVSGYWIRLAQSRLVSYSTSKHLEIAQWTHYLPFTTLLIKALLTIISKCSMLVKGLVTKSCSNFSIYMRVVAIFEPKGCLWLKALLTNWIITSEFFFKKHGSY